MQNYLPPPAGSLSKTLLRNYPTEYSFQNLFYNSQSKAKCGQILRVKTISSPHMSSNVNVVNTLRYHSVQTSQYASRSVTDLVFIFSLLFFLFVFLLVLFPFLFLLVLLVFFLIFPWKQSKNNKSHTSCDIKSLSHLQVTFLKYCSNWTVKYIASSNLST